MNKSNEMLSTDLLCKMDAYWRAANRRRRMGTHFEDPPKIANWIWADVNKQKN
jgi:hypothetical protein